MFLSVDIGNSLIKAGFYENNELTGFYKIEKDELSEELFKDKQVTSCAVSSVVPAITDKLENIINSVYGFTPYYINRNSALNITIDYETPATLGIDRICGSCGAMSLFDESNENNTYSGNDIIITVDFGTATTINVIKYNSKFTGGIIAPGINTMFTSLRDKTAMLPEVTVADYDQVVGRSTKKSMASGVINSTAGLLDKLLTTLSEEKTNPRFHVYLTGGNASLFSPFLNFEHKVVPDLVLVGIKKIYELNRD